MITQDDALAIATRWLANLSAATDADTFANQILPMGWLRDLLCFSWDFRSLTGRPNISTFLSESTQPSNGESRFVHAGLRDFALDTTSTLGPPAPFTLLHNPAVQGVSGAFRFAIASPPAHGRAFFRLVRDADGEWKAQTLFTNLEDLKGHEEPAERPEGYLDTTWEEAHAQRFQEIERDPTVLIVGAGHSGLMCAARFGQMGIRALVIEKTPRVGDVWRNRYPNLSLHTPSYHSFFLYHPWPKTFPKFLPKDKIADFLEAYAIGQEINVWCSSQLVGTPVFDDSTQRWMVEVNRTGERIALSARHIVLATGSMGKPKIPTWPGMDSFAGPIYHSDFHTGAAPYKGKRVIVVGACNAGGDICHDFVLNGASEVTMVQRSATCVLAASTADQALFRHQYPLHYSTEDADFVNNSTPPALILKQVAPGMTKRFKALDQKLLAGLTEAGFKLRFEMTPGGEEVGLLGFLLERVASGTMMDMGCGQLIIDGRVKVKQGQEIKRIEADGIVFDDGSKIKADVIVLATGYGPIIDNGAVGIFGKEIKEKIGPKIWGMDEAGELTNAYRPTGTPRLWFALGAFQQARYLSKHLAIQILADELGLRI